MELDNGFSNPLRGFARDNQVSSTAEATVSPAPSSTSGNPGATPPDKGKPMEYVAPPGHGSGCGHCTGQAQWVPKEQAEQARKKQKADIYADVAKHESAHQSAGKHLAGAAVVRQHADGSADGEVPITVPKVNKQNPEETMSDGDTIIAAAMAPDKPSSQDYRVAATGAALKSEASSFKNSREFKELKPGLFSPPKT